MQILISLYPDFPVRLPFSYYHALSAGIYEILNSMDEKFAKDLHDGPLNVNRIKLLTISPLLSKIMEVHGGGKGSHSKEQYSNYFLLFKGKTFFRIATPIPDIAHACVAAFSNVDFLRIGSQVFRVKSVEILSDPVFKENMTWISPGNSSIVTGWTIENADKKVYQFPLDSVKDVPDCSEIIKHSLVHKWQRLIEKTPEVCAAWMGNGHHSDTNLKDFASGKDFSINIITDHDHFIYKTRLHQLKNNPVRSWRAPVMVKGPEWVQKIVWSCGLGQMNTMGFGLVEEVKL